MTEDEKDLDKLSDNPKNNDGTGEDDMAVIEKELETMQTLQQKKMKRDQLRNALIKQTIRQNREALQRLSRS
ncbi:hypothetical protein ACIQXQ_20720 [Peribacillus sp. NPDC097198]|uniref:hypothetical protein n=1 Tax=Peribacillus sp. NPDC097198 TaxID=3364397 RepID=UPI003810D771